MVVWVVLSSSVVVWVVLGFFFFSFLCCSVGCLDFSVVWVVWSSSVVVQIVLVSGVVSRWERLQSCASERNLRISQQQRDLTKFSSDVDSLLMWLDEAEALQASHDTMPSDIAQLNVIIRQHKVGHAA